MSIKSTITDGDDFCFYHNTLFDDDIKYVFIEFVNPFDCYIAKSQGNNLYAQISFTADNIDKIAFACIKERKLESIFGGPVGKELGSPDCEYK